MYFRAIGCGNARTCRFVSYQEMRGKAKLACKPGSVRPLSKSRQSFIWAASRLAARATYPGAARATLSLPYLVLLRMGFALPFLLPETR